MACGSFDEDPKYLERTAHGPFGYGASQGTKQPVEPESWVEGGYMQRLSPAP